MRSPLSGRVNLQSELAPTTFVSPSPQVVVRPSKKLPVLDSYQQDVALGQYAVTPAQLKKLKGRDPCCRCSSRV